ncbi:hypothetical protein D9M70_260690 [compost metagenome]
MKKRLAMSLVAWVMEPETSIRQNITALDEGLGCLTSRLYLRSKVSRKGTRSMRARSFAISASSSWISLKLSGSSRLSRSSSSLASLSLPRLLPESAMRRAWAERSVRTMLMREGLPSLLMPARTVLKVSAPERCRLTRLGSSRSSNMKSRNSSWVIWKTKSSMPSPLLLALPPPRPPPPPDGRGMRSPAVNSLLPGWTMVCRPPRPWCRTGSSISRPGILICSPCSMSVMERRLTASSTAFLMCSR